MTGELPRHRKVLVTLLIFFAGASSEASGQPPVADRKSVGDPLIRVRFRAVSEREGLRTILDRGIRPAFDWGTSKCRQQQ
jgi:hypothetical protein